MQLLLFLFGRQCKSNYVIERDSLLRFKVSFAVSDTWCVPRNHLAARVPAKTRTSRMYRPICFIGLPRYSYQPS